MALRRSAAPVGAIFVFILLHFYIGRAEGDRRERGTNGPLPFEEPRRGRPTHCTVANAPLEGGRRPPAREKKKNQGKRETERERQYHAVLLLLLLLLN